MKLKYKTMIYYFTISFLVSYIQINGDSCKCNLDVTYYFDEYEGVNISAPFILNETLIYKDSDSIYYTVTVFDCKGSGVVNKYIVPNTLVSISNFTNSLDTLKAYTRVDNYLGITERIEVRKYYQPLPHGKWKYYDKSNHITRVQSFNNGILIYDSNEVK